MTYSHPELYDMVNQGVDLAHATSVAAQWAKLGEALEEIGADLKRAVTQSADGWTGIGAAVTRRTGGGHFGGTLIRDGHAHRGPGMVNWVNTPDGRYAFRQAGDWVTVTPLDPRRFRTMAEELVDAVRAL